MESTAECGPATSKVTSALCPLAESSPAWPAAPAPAPAPASAPADRPAARLAPVPAGRCALTVPAGDRLGAVTSMAAPGSRSRAAVTWRTAWRICGSLARVSPAEPGPRGWMSTLSDGGVVTPSWASTRSAWPAWPGSYCGTLLVPSRCPATKATATRPSQPVTAVFACRALQPAIRSTTGRFTTARFTTGRAGRSGTGG